MSQHYHHRIGAREKAIERHNPGTTAGYPFLGDYKVEKELAHGHGPRPPTTTHPSYLCLRISGSNIVVDEISISGNETLQCAIGEVNPKHPIIPQQRSLSQFQFTGQRLSFPDNARAYCLSTHVKNIKTSAIHHMQLIVRGSEDGHASRPGTPRNTPRKALTNNIGNDDSNLIDDGNFLKVRSDSNLDYTLNISADGNPPLLLPAGSQISVAAKKELLILPNGDGPNHDAILAQKQIILKTAPGSNAPIGIQVGNTNLLALANGTNETKIAALDAVNQQILLHPPVIPQLDYSFDLSSDSQMTIFSAAISPPQQQQQQQQNTSWKIILSAPSLGLLSETSTSSTSTPSTMLQFCAARAVEVIASVWGINATSAILTQKIRIPVLNPNAVEGNNNNSNSNNLSPEQQVAPIVQIKTNDNSARGERKIQVTSPPELSTMVSADGLSWYPGLPGISVPLVNNEPQQHVNPVTHVSVVERATKRKLTQLHLDVDTSDSILVSDWIPQLAAALNAGALDDHNTNNNNNNNNNNNGGDSAASSPSSSTSARLFNTLTPPTTPQEKNLLLSLQNAFDNLLNRLRNSNNNNGNIHGGAPRFSVTYFPPASEGETGRFENVRCDNAASLSLQTGGSHSQPIVIATNSSVSAPKQSDPNPAVIFASDLAGRIIAALEFREDPSVYSAFSGLRNYNNNNTNNSRTSSAICFNLGNDPNTLTGFYCADASRMQVGVTSSSIEQVVPTDIVSFQSVVSVANGQKALIRAIDSHGSTINQAIVEGNRNAGSKSLAELWSQIEQALSGNPDATSNLRTLKPGSDPWLEELVRVLRNLADYSKRTFEIRYRGPHPDDKAIIETGGLNNNNRFVDITESNPVKVPIGDRVATVIVTSDSVTAASNNNKKRGVESDSLVEISEKLLRALTTEVEGSIDKLRDALTRLRPVTNADEKIQDSLLDIANQIVRNAKSSSNNPIRFSLPRGVALRNLRCDRHDAVLYATINGGRKERLMNEGETMPPAALQATADTMEIEAVVIQSTTTTANSNNTMPSVIIGKIVCSFTSDNNNPSTGGDCIGFDCELIPDGDEAVVNLTAPSGYQIIPRVDGLKGNSLGSRGLIRVDPHASHVIQINIEDKLGRCVVKQNLFFPRVCLPKCDFFFTEGGVLGAQCPRGTKVLAVVDGGPERNMASDPNAVTFDCDRPHVFGLRFLADSISREGTREMSRVGEISLKLPTLFSAADILELCRLLKEHDPTNPSNFGVNPQQQLPPRLAQLATNTKSQTIREIACVISALCGAGLSGGNGGSNTFGHQKQPSGSGGVAAILRPQPVILQNNPSSASFGGASSRAPTPRDAILFRLNGDANNDDNVESALP